MGVWQEPSTGNDQGTPGGSPVEAAADSLSITMATRAGHQQGREPFGECPKLESGGKGSNITERSGGCLDPFILLLGHSVWLNSNCTLGLL